LRYLVDTTFPAESASMKIGSVLDERHISIDE